MIPCAKSGNGGLTVARKPNPDKRASLLEQQKAIAAKLKAIDLSDKKTARKNDTRVKVITWLNRADGYREKPAKPAGNPCARIAQSVCRAARPSPVPVPASGRGRQGKAARAKRGYRKAERQKPRAGFSRKRQEGKARPAGATFCVLKMCEAHCRLALR